MAGGSVLRHVKSNKRPEPLQPADYDHEIFLIETHRPTAKSRSRSQSGRDTPRAERDLSPVSAARRQSLEQSRKKRPLRDEIAKRRYARYQAQREDTTSDTGLLEQERSITPPTHIEDAGAASSVGPSKTLDAPQTDPPEACLDRQPRGRSIPSTTPKKPNEIVDSHIDILYENERGLFLCGRAFFSKAALGAADARPWTNENHKPSLSDINNHQPPDPTWEWAWAQWKINHDSCLGDDEQDEDGWEYSFAYSKKSRFSWHGPNWYSYVRRRAWTRKRVRKQSGYLAQTEGHMLNADYFTIHPSQLRSRSPATYDATSRAGSKRESKAYSTYTVQRREMEEAITQHEISDIGLLMRALRFCRIDREKTEIVESFIENGEDDLFYLKEKMSEIMSSFIFQAARKLLLSHLMEKLDSAITAREARVNDESRRADAEDDGEESSEEKRIVYLKEAVKAADDQVKELEYWSDIKAMATDGDIPRAVDENHGWSSESWAGLDDSGPRNVISAKDEAGYERAMAEKKSANVETKELEDSYAEGQKAKGKGRAV